MQGKVYLRHKLGSGSGITAISGHLQWYSNSILRIVTDTLTYEVPVENVAALVFNHGLSEVVKDETKKTS